MSQATIVARERAGGVALGQCLNMVSRVLKRRENLGVKWSIDKSLCDVEQVAEFVRARRERLGTKGTRVHLLHSKTVWTTFVGWRKTSRLTLVTNATAYGYLTDSTA